MIPYFQQDGITIYHGDCRDVLSDVAQPGSIILTDPPYGTGGWRRSGAGQGGNPSGTLVMESWDDGATDWLGLGCPDAVLSFWPPAKTLSLLTAANSAGYNKHRALYWNKPDPKPQPAGRIRWSVEPIWVLSRDGFVLKGGTDWTTASTPRMNRDREAVGHPYQKPIRVLHWLIQKLPPATLIDPFAGSGTTLVAARELGYPAIGIEESEQYCEIAAKRLQQFVMALA